VIVLVGVTVASVWGPHGTNPSSLSEILGYFTNRSFVAFAALTFAMVGGYVLLLHHPSLQRWRPLPTSLWTTALSAYTAAACGALSQLFVKVVSIALHEASVVGAHALAHPAIPVSLIGLLTTAPLQLYLLNSALNSSPVSYAVPFYQALLVLFTTAAGGIFFLEFATTTTSDNLAYFGGAALTIGGLTVLGTTPAQELRATEHADDDRTEPAALLGNGGYEEASA